MTPTSNSTAPSFGRPRSGVLALICMALLAGSAPAQTVTAPTAVGTLALKSDDTPVVLSLFVISEESTSGYLATSTLAGTRLKTNLRDLAAAISVATPEFMADTAASSLEELLPYTASTEIGGAFGNYSAADISADGSGRADQDATRRDPQSGARVRGMQAPNYTRSYLIGSQDDIPIGVDPDGFTSLYRIAPERAWYLTNTFSF